MRKLKVVRRKKLLLKDSKITYASTPDYDEWGYDTYWSCNDWIEWHKQLKAKYGSVEANRRWIQAWEKQSIDESNYNWCKYNSNFNSFLKRENISGASHVLANVVVKTTSAVENTADLVEGATSILKNKFVLGGLFLGVCYVGYRKLN